MTTIEARRSLSYEGKTPYPTREDARRAALRMKLAERDFALSSYHCPACGQFHLGHTRENGKTTRLASGAIGRPVRVRRRKASGGRR